MDSPQVSRVLCFDWNGMGGSERASCSTSPRRSALSCSTASHNVSSAVNFFVDPLEELMDGLGLQDITLVGHSLGGYLSSRYLLKYPGRVRHLILASPVGFPPVPQSTLSPRSLPLGLRLIDTLWKTNFTPQQIVRMAGGRRGKDLVTRALRARLQSSISEMEGALLGEYLYHITCAKASGEYSMNSLLKPAVTMHSAHIYAREDLETLMTDSLGLKTFKVLFGDKDWMKYGEPSARVVAQRLHGQNGLNAKVEILSNAGHHLYLDNIPSFHNSILQV